jgi:hypothetical protein
MCLGLAAVIHVDTDRCAAGAGTTQPNSGAHARATIKARHDGNATGSQAPAQMTGNCTASVAATSSTAPFSPTTAGGFAGAGFGLAAIGKVLRRLRRPLTV